MLVLVDFLVVAMVAVVLEQVEAVVVSPDYLISQLLLEILF